MFRVRGFMNKNFLAAEYEEQSVGLISERNMEARAEHQKVKYYQSFYTLTTSVGVGIIGVVLFWILYFRNGFAWHSNPGILFNWHPLLMVIGMFFLHSQSLLIYRTGRNYQKKPVKYLHAILHFIAFILSVIALVAVFDSHNLRNVPNLYTLHSWIGLSTVIVFSAQFLFGFITFLFPGFSQSLRKVILQVHVIIGTGCFIAATISVVSGFSEKAIFALKKEYSTFPSEGILINFIGFMAAIYGILVLYLVNEFLFGFITFLFPGLSHPLRKAILPLHVCFGTGCFIAATITATSGFLEIAIFALDKTYSTFPSEGILINIIGLCVAIYGIMVVYMVNEVNYKRVNLDDDQIILDRSE